MCQLPRFTAALEALAPTNTERAKALDVDPRTITRYRNHELPQQITQLMKCPELLRALADDAEQGCTCEQIAA